MKGFLYGLTAGLAAGVAAQMMIAKNHEQMLELVRNLPHPLKFNPNASLDDLLAQKDKLDELIVRKQAEAETDSVAEEEEEEDQEQEESDPS